MCYQVPATSLRSGTFVFLLGFVWHIKLLPLFHALVGKEWLATLSLHPDLVHTFRDLDLQDPLTRREFALLGAFSHTFVFVLGLLCALIFQRLRRTYYLTQVKNRVNSRARVLERTEAGKTAPLSSGAVVLLTFSAAFAFNRFILQVLRYCYDVRFPPVIRFANVFFHEQGGQLPFAWASSVSYTTVFVLGFMLSAEEHRLRFERVLIPSKTLRGWAVPMTIAFVGWIGTMQTVTVPLFLSSLKHEENVAFLIGVMFCSAVPVVYTLVRSSGVRLSGLSAAPRATVLAELWAVFFEVMHTILLSSLFASFLVTIAMYTNERILDPQALVWLFSSGVFARVCLTLALCTVMAPLVTGETTIVAATQNVVRKIKEVVVVTLLWNVHLVTFFGLCGSPFVALAMLKSAGVVQTVQPYTYVDAFNSWVSYICFGPYGTSICYQGPMRALCVKLKIEWNGPFRNLFFLLNTVPIIYPNYTRWTHNSPDVYVYFIMSIIHLVYVLTYRGEPEKDCESRIWPAFCSGMKHCIRYIESYFQFSIRLEDPTLVANVDDAKPHIFGFHPHGVYPCAVIWVPLSTTFSRVFGSRFKVHSVTDFFTHIVPFMRDICQWGGGVEVCKKVVDRMLTEKRNIMIVPGGQREILLHTLERMDQKEIALYAGHKGFVRMAMRHRATLIPTFQFNELQNLENIRMPKLQSLARKVLGFPMPFIPVGVKGVLPIPRNNPMTLVVGKPISTECADPGNPTDAEVKALHRGIL